jgi:hypothetical protein
MLLLSLNYSINTQIVYKFLLEIPDFEIHHFYVFPSILNPIKIPAKLKMSYKINSSAEEKIKLAKDDSVDRLYERTNQRTIRVLTVCLYVLCVSLAAIILSCYYLFLWDPKDAYRKLNQTQHKQCGNYRLVVGSNPLKIS